MVGLDYEESCKKGECPFIQICRRSFYERKRSDRCENEDVNFWRMLFVILQS